MCVNDNLTAAGKDICFHLNTLHASLDLSCFVFLFLISDKTINAVQKRL